MSALAIDFAQLAEGLDHSEGLAWDPRTGVIYAGGEAGQVYRVTLDGLITEVATTGGSLLGLVVDGAGRIYCCDADRGEVVRVDPGSGAVEAYSRLPMVCPNAACFDDAGNLYVTQSGDTKADNGSIVRVAPGGETTIWSSDLPRYPNGICLAADGRSLYVAESYLPGVSRVPIEPDGSAGRPELVCELPRSVPDGVAFDADGTLYVSCYRPDRIYRMRAGEAPAVLADDWEGVVLNAPTNVAFVGAELDRLAVANVGEVTLVIGDVGRAWAAAALPGRAVSGRFDDRNVLVTGAARGIGRAIVTAFLEEGATVLAADVDEGRLAQTAAEIASPRLHTRVGDIADTADAQAMVEHAVATFGRLHVLVNNAGVMPDGPILEVDEALFERTFSINVTGPFFATQAAARHMCANGGGAIVSIASANVFQGESPEAPYNASKAAVVALARSFAHELGHLGLRVNCVAPGETLTPEAVGRVESPTTSRASANTRAASRCDVPAGPRSRPPRCSSWPRTTPRSSTGRR